MYFLERILSIQTIYAAFVQLSMRIHSNINASITIPQNLFHALTRLPSHFIFRINKRAQQKTINQRFLFEVLQSFMNLLVAWMIILIVKMADCLWYQDGHWTRQVYSNNSFLYTFLKVEEGQARLEVRQGQAGLLRETSDQMFLKIKLLGISEGKEANKFMKILIKMKKNQGKKTLLTNIQKSIDFSFFSLNVSNARYQQSYEYQKQYKNVSFNISYTHRKYLELRSHEDVFRIQLIDIEQISPKIHNHLWLILILLFVLVVGHIAVAILTISIHHNDKSYIPPTLGFWTNQLLLSWIIKSVYNIYQQTYYLSDTQDSSLLAIASWIIMIILGVDMLLRAGNLNFADKTPKAHLLFVLTVTLTSVSMLFFETFIPPHLQYYLAVVIAYQIITIHWAIQDNKTMKNIHIAMHMFLYMFPCIIFPVFSFETRYPQQQVQIWWLYGLFYIVEVVLFLMIPVRATCFKFKRLVKLEIQKFIASQNQVNLLEKVCPLCLKEVQISQIELSSAGEAPQVDWIQAGCKHYFHKVCVRQNMKDIDCCQFDKTKWSEEFKKSA